MRISTDTATSAMRRNRNFVAAAMKKPLLTQAHELDLARRWRNDKDEEALHELVSAYLRLVVATASKFRAYGLPTADLVQEGCIGLMQAAARFEPEREVRFSTYASWWIRSSMQEYILRNWSIVRSGTSAAQKSLFFNLRWLKARIDGGERALPTETARRAIAKELKVSENDVDRMAMRLQGRDQSLNDPLGEEGGEEWGDFLTDDAPSPEDMVIHLHDSKVRGRWLYLALSELTDREQLIIRERRLRDDRVTLEELGGRLGITKERVRQIEHKAFEKLQASVTRRWRDAVGPMAATGTPRL